MEDVAAELEKIDLTGARLRMVRVKDARMRMVDASNAVLRDVDLSGTSIDGANVDGLTVNGVEVGPLIEAELTRREPARAFVRSSDPADLRKAWELLTQSWEGSYRRVQNDPSLVDASVDGEWSFVQTLRHLVFATDAWLGSAIGSSPRYHPWGIPFTGYTDYVDGGAAAFGLDPDATPAYDEVLGVRRERVANVRDLLASATPETLAVEIAGPPWADGETVSVLHSLQVVLDEEIEHHRFAERDLDLAHGRGEAP